MNDNPRDFPEWMRKVDRQLRNNSRAAMRGLTEVRDTVDAVTGDIDGIKDTIGNLPVPPGTPTAPVELTGQSALYIDEHGTPQSRVSIDFPDVVRTVTGQPITVRTYELQGYEQTATPLQDSRAAYPGRGYPGSTYPGTARNTKGLDPVWTMLGTSDTSSFVKFGLTQGQVWVFRVRASGGEWSAPIRIETLRDTTPPPQPAAPSVTASRGTLVVRWDGMAVTGPQPADFETAVLVGGPDPSPGADRELYRWGPQGGTFVQTEVPYYETWFFRIRTMDQSGNWSVWSAQSSGYPSPMVDADIILTELDAARTHLKNVDAGVSILPDTIITEHLHVTESMSAAVGEFLHVNADMLEANEIWADTAWLGFAEANLIKSDLFVGKEFEGGTFTGTTFRSAATGARTELTSDGLRQVDGLGRELLKIGYGIETGLAVRNPNLGQLVPLDRMVFGSEVLSGTVKRLTAGITYPTYTNGEFDIPLYDSDRHTNTNYTEHPLLTFVAKSNRHLLNVQTKVSANLPLGHAELKSIGATINMDVEVKGEGGAVTPIQWSWLNGFFVPYAMVSLYSVAWSDVVTGLTPGATYSFRIQLRSFGPAAISADSYVIRSTPI